jgi:putative NIF3 family GTP cyclohydrolase 1 type 2
MEVLAVLPGSGKSEIDLALKAGADVMITGDINHHAGIDAVEKGIAVIDAGHYGVEKLFVPYMANFLKNRFPELEIFLQEEKEYFTEV